MSAKVVDRKTLRLTIVPMQPSNSSKEVISNCDLIVQSEQQMVEELIGVTHPLISKGRQVMSEQSRILKKIGRQIQDSQNSPVSARTIALTNRHSDRL
ncbi:hypothetical protein PoB_005569700 [Plakobranchus ocellatus]|uniref:V-SNARE coiled-coil homology domain-containing protein n=1 Tax=Plakobranchus ocellatus TaxID=259542 RepID=A0AAV4CDB9_9GAST|nr:hypothetical protein PoB_005569700 [Plakobranchus ocellatus]